MSPKHLLFYSDWITVRWEPCNSIHCFGQTRFPTVTVIIKIKRMCQALSRISSEPNISHCWGPFLLKGPWTLAQIAHMVDPTMAMRKTHVCTKEMSSIYLPIFILLKMLNIREFVTLSVSQSLSSLWKNSCTHFVTVFVNKWTNYTDRVYFLVLIFFWITITATTERLCVHVDCGTASSCLQTCLYTHTR